MKSTNPSRRTLRSLAAGVAAVAALSLLASRGAQPAPCAALSAASRVLIADGQETHGKNDPKPGKPGRSLVG